MDFVPVEKLPLVKHDETVLVARMEYPSVDDILGDNKTCKNIPVPQKDGSTFWVPEYQVREALMYGGPTRMRVVDNLEEAIDIFYKCNCCVDDDDHPLGPHLWVLSPNTYCAIMSRADGLRYIEPGARKLLSVPYQINPRIR